MKNNDLPDVVVVGNSPTVLLNEIGDKIDSFKTVIRVNKCVTQGYEKYIGKRTSIWSTTDNERWNFYIPESIEDKKIWLRTPRTLKKMNSANQFQKVCQTLEYDSLEVDVLFKTENSNAKISQYFNSSEDRFWENDLNHEPCTGLLTILKAVYEFGKVAVVGFTFSTDDIDGGSFEYYRKDEAMSGESLTNEEHAKNQKNGSASFEEGARKMKVLQRLFDLGLVVPLNPDELKGVKIKIENKNVVIV